MFLRTTLAAATVLAALAPAEADARLFVQTYGATVPAADGCVWNANQDYFVPRYCDSCRYGLFSACKDARGVSAACRNCHAVYPGYCSPYGACRYRWRDHVYKAHCGCTPLRRYHGPWRVATCRRGCGCLANPGCRQASCRAAMTACPSCPGVAWAGGLECSDCQVAYLPNVEPAGGIRLGQLPAEQLGGAAGIEGPAAAAGVSLPTLPPAQTQPLPTALPSVGGF